jgi:uncharacterized protein (TIGR02246 family)
MCTQSNADLVQGIKNAMESDDVDGFMMLFTPDAEWVMLATGETYRGREQISQILKRALFARTHTENLGFNVTNTFSDAEGTKLCLEYLHKGIVGEKWPSSSAHRPAPGTEFELPIVWILDTHQGKIVKMREYFDMLTIINAGTREKLFS